MYRFVQVNLLRTDILKIICRGAGHPNIFCCHTNITQSNIFFKSCNSTSIPLKLPEIWQCPVNWILRFLKLLITILKLHKFLPGYTEYSKNIASLSSDVLNLPEITIFNGSPAGMEPTIPSSNCVHCVPNGALNFKLCQ